MKLESLIGQIDAFTESKINDIHIQVNVTEDNYETLLRLARSEGFEVHKEEAFDDLISCAIYIPVN